MATNHFLNFTLAEEQYAVDVVQVREVMCTIYCARSTSGRCDKWRPTKEQADQHEGSVTTPTDWKLCEDDDWSRADSVLW